jgi:hypothetical protein
MKKAEATIRFRLFKIKKQNIDKYEKKEQGSQGGSTPVSINNWLTTVYVINLTAMGQRPRKKNILVQKFWSRQG